jgi:hypothetical protein
VAKKEMRVGIDVFVRLKKGTISDYYETGEVLGEGLNKDNNLKALTVRCGR